MAISYVDTDRVEEISKDIVSLSNELNNEINNLFKRFSEVPTITREWVGNQALFYFNRISNDKKQYIDFVNNLREIGYKLSRDSYAIQMCMKKNNNEEQKKERYNE